MKRKSLYHHILIGIAAISYPIFAHESLSLNKPVNQEPLDRYLELTSGLPSQLETNALRAFFEKNYTFNALQSRALPRTSRNDKNSLFSDSLSTFVKTVYNKDSYAERLSCDGSHFIEFLRIGNELGIDAELAYTCQRLLFNKAKQCEIVDYTVVESVIRAYPDLTKGYFSKKQKKGPSKASIALMEKSIDVLILSKFTNHLPLFQEKPDAFITELAKEITQFSHKKLLPFQKKGIEEEGRERLRSIIKQISELLMSKMMWDPTAYQSIKPSFISLGDSLVRMAEKGVLDHMDDLDDLLMTLVSRLCFFFDLYGSVIPSTVYDEFMVDLQDKTLFFLEVEEQDKEVTPKKTLLMHALVRGKAKAIARENQGMQSDQASF